MIILKNILLVIHLTVSAAMIASILLQAPKGGGLSGSMFGGGGGMSSSLFGARSAANMLSKATQYLAGAFLVLSLVISLLVGAGSIPVQESVTQKVLQQTPAANLPQVESYDMGDVNAGTATDETTPTGETESTESGE